MRFSAGILAVLTAAVVVVGCAGSRPTDSPAARSEAEPAALSADEQLDVARTEYLQGVRAYVREDYSGARDLLLRSQAKLELLFVADVLGGLETREAQSLLAKSDYFLVKMDEQESLLAPEPGPEVAESAVPVPSEARWEVVHGTIEPVDNEAVQRWVHYFLNDGRPVLQKWLNRQSRYVPIYEQAFAKYGMPPELVYHSMIESGFSTSAYSWAHAVGLWQFIRATGRLYGLRCDWWVDERRDPVKSTDAAVRYLRDLYVEFEDWDLALAAYNVGEAKIRRQIRRQKTRDFWKLRLPRETRNHVPKFYAALEIGTNPEKYGFRLQPLAPIEGEVILVDFCVDFEVLAECAGVTSQQIAERNPSLVRRCTPPEEAGYPVIVPVGSASRASSELAKLPADKRVLWAHHRVSRGDNLSTIARRYRTTVTAIAEANRLRSVHRLSIGQDLLIPQGRPTGANPPTYASGPTPGSGGSAEASSGRRKVVYTVKQGDTLSEIADRHGTSSRMLRRWNRVGRFIYPGQRLTIYTSKSADFGDLVVKVRKGDTLWDIARLHGVSLQDLLAENNLSRGHKIRPGDLIKVPRRS